jgi:hypothetical protein
MINGFKKYAKFSLSGEFFLIVTLVQRILILIIWKTAQSGRKKTSIIGASWMDAWAG